jgi:hypothetical protein
VLSLLASGTQDRGFEAVGLFRRKNPQHAFLRRGSLAVCPMSQICGMLKNPVIYVEVEIIGQTDRPFLARNSVLHFSFTLKCQQATVQNMKWNLKL